MFELFEVVGKQTKVKLYEYFSVIFIISIDYSDLIRQSLYDQMGFALFNVHLVNVSHKLYHRLSRISYG